MIITTIMSDVSPGGALNDAGGGGQTAVPDLLLIWMSPSFPVGAFAFSHGLEKLVEDGIITGRHDLDEWLADLASIGSLRNDLILAAEAWRAAMALDALRLETASELALALQPSSERHLEAVTQGGSFLAAVRAAWPAPGLDMHRDGEVAYPIAVGLAAAAHGLPLRPVLSAYAVAFASNLVSAAIRLSVLGQTDGQRVLAAMLPLCREAAARAEMRSLDDLGSATLRTDLASLFHETQYSRLFRS